MGEGAAADKALGEPTPDPKDPKEARSRKLLAAKRDAEHRAGQLNAKVRMITAVAKGGPCRCWALPQVVPGCPVYLGACVRPQAMLGDPRCCAERAQLCARLLHVL